MRAVLEDYLSFAQQDFGRAIRIGEIFSALYPVPGISYVQLRKSVPAVKSFDRIITALDEGVEGVEDESRMRDLAYLSMARTFYSASVRLDDSSVPKIDAKKLSAAVKNAQKKDNVQICRISVPEHADVPGLLAAMAPFFARKYGPAAASA